jgi:hypothetical protein
MSTTAPVIFTQFTVGDTPANANASGYNTHAVEGREITVEEETVEVDDGQLLLNSYLVTFRVTTYASGIRNETRVQFNGTTAVNPAIITFTGASGAATMTISGIRLIGKDLPNANGRRGFEIFGQKRVTTNPITFS